MNDRVESRPRTASPARAPSAPPAPVPPPFPESFSLFAPAPQPEMVRAFQKDTFILSLLRDDLQEVAAGLMGMKRALLGMLANWWGNQAPYVCWLG
jgi:hypothetical protein